VIVYNLEAKWLYRLPSLFSKALETEPTMYKSGTLVLLTGQAFFCQSRLVLAQAIQDGWSLTPAGLIIFNQ
jgi:hypothetical protein